MAEIQVNEGHYNLAPIGGVVTRMLRGTDLGGYVYVSGLSNEYDRDFYFDVDLGEDVYRLVDFLSLEVGISAEVGLPNRPHHRPGISITRRAREDVLLVAKICGLVFLYLNDRLEFNELV